MQNKYNIWLSDYQSFATGNGDSPFQCSPVTLVIKPNNLQNAYLHRDAGASGGQCDTKLPTMPSYLSILYCRAERNFAPELSDLFQWGRSFVNRPSLGPCPKISWRLLLKILGQVAATIKNKNKGWRVTSGLLLALQYGWLFLTRPHFTFKTEKPYTNRPYRQYI